MEEYVIVSFLNNPESIVIDKNNPPIHLTVLGTFYAETPQDTLIALLKDVSNRHDQLSVMAKSRDFFGPEKDIAVVEMQKPAELAALHMDLVQTFTPYIGRFKSPHYNGENFSPHITDQKSEKIEITDTVTLTSMSLLNVHTETADILATVKLQS